MSLEDCFRIQSGGSAVRHSGKSRDRGSVNQSAELAVTHCGRTWRDGEREEGREFVRLDCRSSFGTTATTKRTNERTNKRTNERTNERFLPLFVRSFVRSFVSSFVRSFVRPSVRSLAWRCVSIGGARTFHFEWQWWHEDDDDDDGRRNAGRRITVLCCVFTATETTNYMYREGIQRRWVLGCCVGFLVHQQSQQRVDDRRCCHTSASGWRRLRPRKHRRNLRAVVSFRGASSKHG